jgi:hypothetical protein
LVSIVHYIKWSHGTGSIGLPQDRREGGIPIQVQKMIFLSKHGWYEKVRVGYPHVFLFHAHLRAQLAHSALG